MKCPHMAKPKCDRFCHHMNETGDCTYKRLGDYTVAQDATPLKSLE